MNDERMTSCSHWGMFEYPLRPVLVVRAEDITDEMIREWNKPGYIIPVRCSDNLPMVQLA